MNYLRFCDILIILNIIFSHAYYLYDIIEYSDMFRERGDIKMSENTLNMLIKAYRLIPISEESREVVAAISQYHDKYMSMINNHKDCDIHPIR